VKGTTAKVGFLGSNRVITSLTFITNKHTHGPYGVLNGSEFGSFPSRLVTGIFGKASNSLDQLGVITTIDWETTHRYLVTHRRVETTTTEQLLGGARSDWNNDDPNKPQSGTSTPGWDGVQGGSQAVSVHSHFWTHAWFHKSVTSSISCPHACVRLVA
jgi:hypothetical protein